MRNSSEGIALKLFGVLHNWYNQSDRDKCLKKQFFGTARKWLILSVKYKLRQLSKAIVQIHGMETLSFREAMINAAVVDWGDLSHEWLKREKNLLRNEIERYQFAQYLGRSLEKEQSMKLSFIKTVLIEIRTNSAPLLRGCHRSDVSSIIRQIQETRAEGESASIKSLVRALKDVRVIPPLL